jgi:hypothetical protein
VKARIVGANLRDLTYIAANMRPEDRREVECQLAQWDASLIALTAMQGPAYIVELDGNPEAAFGAAEQRVGLWQAWSWGTKRMNRCVPAITRFFYAVLGPHVSEQGAWRVEARPIAGNELACRWLARLGATRRCELPGYGKNGEDFELWDWTRESWANVFLQTTRAQAAAGQADR